MAIENKTPEKAAPKKTKRPKRWHDRRKVIKVDDFAVTFEEDGKIETIGTWHVCMRSPEYREWLVDQGFWIPSMDLSELPFSIYPDSSEDEDEIYEKMMSKKGKEVKESLSKRMKKLKAQQKGRFSFFAEENEKRKSKNSKSAETKKVDQKKVAPKVARTENIENPKQKKAVKAPKKAPPKQEDKPPKETIRSHYCYTEMHLASGKEVKKKF
ncbi:hypothetical protein CAEBREN_03473 [Caenorhabditis brenneri]|uniref:Uncharacterized protein n=1 Tax=Caenorhabditis brenneri TaxID=135651 RepID=G0MNB5_CAEBE|nr:hypothetical protein CAEBREN_03473 [Caenorhabditis brenneri]